MAKRKRHKPEEIVRKLQEAEVLLRSGEEFGVVLQRLGVSEPTYHRWRQEYEGMGREQVRRLKELEQENSRLRSAVADLWSSEDVLEVILGLMNEHGIPLCLRSDNGPELTAKELEASLEGLGLELLYIEPGSPWQNGAVESLIAILRNEFLNEHRFRGVVDAAAESERYREIYNTKRHGSLGMRTPAQAGGRVTKKPVSEL